jgi:hypothetical protein
MPVTFRFYVGAIEEDLNSFKYLLWAVYDKKVGGEDPNRRFWEATPNGQMTFSIQKSKFPTRIWDVGQVVDLTGTPVAVD